MKANISKQIINPIIKKERERTGELNQKAGVKVQARSCTGLKVLGWNKWPAQSWEKTATTSERCFNIQYSIFKGQFSGTCYCCASCWLLPGASSKLLLPPFFGKALNHWGCISRESTRDYQVPVSHRSLIHLWCRSSHHQGKKWQLCICIMKELLLMSTSRFFFFFSFLSLTGIYSVT